ncbi:MAG TPA: DUF1080 domain-containing protein [Planctomycetaceae bacterium]|nr:glycosyl hydrolase [Blastopirellula sp.]HAY81858.1 DUF1080 domain-containing protein [Planctomycetaceae bacterium]
MSHGTRWLQICGLSLLGLGSTAALWAEVPNSLSDAESRAGFRLLFNGQDLEGWRHQGNWKVEQGAISRTGRGGSLVYGVQKVPDDFELRFEWKVAPGSNSGIYYRPGQYEYQILDNRLHRDGKNPRTSAASLYFCMQPSRDVTRPAGQWNTGRIVCQGTVIQHWLNGQKVVGFDYADPRWKAHVDLLRARGGDVASRGADLSLQDHGDPVWYRSLKLRALKSTDMLDETEVVPQAIPPEVLAAEKKKLEGIIKRRQQAQQKKQ